MIKLIFLLRVTSIKRQKKAKYDNKFLYKYDATNKFLEHIHKVFKILYQTNF